MARYGLLGTRHLVIGLGAMCIMGCDGSSSTEVWKRGRVAAAMTSVPLASALGPLTTSYVEGRVHEARKRLQRSAPGRKILRSLQAHGGMSSWYRQGTLAFGFDYAPVARARPHLHTFNIVDLWRSRAWHRQVGKPGEDTAEFAFDGDATWIKPELEAFPISPRFWALTPFYFVAIPWVMADPGVVLDSAPPAQLMGKTYDVVKVSFEEGIGDSPDDYYVLYIDRDSHLVKALRYVVTYPGFYAQGTRSKEKLMIRGGFKKVKGFTLPTTLHTYQWDEIAQRTGSKVTHIRAYGFKLGEQYRGNLFDPPAGAIVSTRIDKNPR